ERAGFDGVGAVLPQGIDLVVRDAGGATANVAVTDAAIQRRRVTATVRNFGTAARAADVHAIADDRPIGGRRVVIAGGEAGEVSFDSPFDIQRARVAVDDPDGYAADNERFAVSAPR